MSDILSTESQEMIERYDLEALFSCTSIDLTVAKARALLLISELARQSPVKPVVIPYPDILDDGTVYELAFNAFTTALGYKEGWKNSLRFLRITFGRVQPVSLKVSARSLESRFYLR